MSMKDPHVGKSMAMRRPGTGAADLCRAVNR